MAANQIVGQITTIGPTQNLTAKSGNPYQIRELVISVRRYDPNTGEPVTDWENTPKFNFFGDKCRELDRFQIGQMVTISFDLNGRKFMNADGVEDIITEARPYRIELYGQRQQQVQQPVATPAPSYPQYPQQPIQGSPAPMPQYPPQPQQQGYVDPFPSK